MTELEKAVMQTDEDDVQEEAVVTENAEEEALRESTVNIEKMKREIKAENDMLNAEFMHVKETVRTVPAQRRRYYYIGTVSAAASLILMGVAMTVSLFSPVGVLSALKVAPLMLVFLGLETGYAVFRNRSARLRYNLKSLILTVLLILVSFIMSLISVTNSATGGERYYAEERLKNMLDREISAEFSDYTVKDVDIKIHLYGDDPSDYENIRDLKDSDVIDMEIKFINAQCTMQEFASSCRRIMDSMMKMPYNFGTVSFSADDDINSFHLSINWLYQSDFRTTELIPLINYFGNDIVMDIPDLVETE